LGQGSGEGSELIENALYAFKNLDETSMFPEAPAICNHKVDLLVLLEMGISQVEGKCLIRNLEGTASGETLLTNIGNLKATNIMEAANNLLSRSLVLWMILFRLIERHSFSCASNSQVTSEFIAFNDPTPFVWSLQIDELKFSNRVQNALERAGIENLGELIEWTDQDLMDIPYLGAKGLREIKAKIKEFEVGQRHVSIPEALGLDTPIDQLNLSTRTYNALRRIGIDTTQQLRKLTEYELRDIRNFGEKSIKEVREVLGKLEVDSDIEFSTADDHPVNLLGWLKEQLSKEIDYIQELTSDLSTLSVSQHFQLLSEERANHKSIYANYELLGDVISGLKLAISNISSGKQGVIVSYTLHLFQKELAEYTESIGTSYPSKELRDSLLAYENKYSDDSVDLLKFDGLTNFYLGITENVPNALLNKVTFFELLETVREQFVPNCQTWAAIQKVVGFHKEWGTFPNLMGFLVARKIFGRDSENELNVVLTDYFNSKNPASGMRDLDMLTLRLEGETLDSIGSKYDLTRERARQIIVKLAPGLDLVSRYLSVDENDKSSREISIKVQEIISRYGAIYKSELSAELKLPEEEALRVVPKEFQKFIIDRNPEPLTFTAWTKEQVIREIQKASTYYFPLRTADYEYLIQIGEITGPSVPYIYNKFGTWREVCAEAGVEAAQAMRSEYVKLWSEEELLGFVRRFFQEPGLSSSIGSYDSWRERQPDHVPSGVLIRNVFGNWTTVKKKTLETMRTNKGKVVL
jgi:hypothetical protein